MTATHRHKPIKSETYGFTRCVSRNCNSDSHGGITIVETCECGAKRRTNSTGRGREERSRWERD